MKRREFIGLVCGLAAPATIKTVSAFAEGSKLIVWISALGYAPGRPVSTLFLKGMEEQGYVKDRDFAYAERGGHTIQDAVRVVEEAIQLRPDIILAPSTLEAVAAKTVTSTIPIICPTLADAVHLGLIASEARPGGNVTGIAPYIGGLPSKQIELAREVLPDATKIGLLTNDADPKGPPQVRELNAAAQALGLQIVKANADRPEEIEAALQALANEKVDIAIILETTMFVGFRSSRSLISASALQKRLPTVFGYREHVVDGGLISYGVDLRWCIRRAAYFAVKILRGASPSDLPIEFPTSMWLAANQQTARALGITIPPSLLARADEVIE
jgi:putative tryptophan/tyrosine transport system substrate-binding protein